MHKDISREIKKILIPRFDTIGDIILFEGFLEAVLNRYANAEIVLAVQEAYLPLKSLFPDRIRWVTTKAYPYRDPDAEELVRLMNELAREQWDLILTTTFNRTYIDESIALRFNDVRNIAIGGEREISWKIKDLWQKIGLKKEPLGYEFIAVEELSTETEKHRSFWEKLTGEKSIPEPRLILPEDLLKNTERLLSDLGIDKDKFCICVPAGIANVKIKKWPEERFADVIAWMEKEFGIRTLLVGHENEGKIVTKVAFLSTQKGANPSLWLGKDGEIPLLASICKKANFYLGNDTGPMHIAAAVNTPVVGIFGGGHWPRFLPTGKGVAVVREMTCFNCNWNCVFENAPCVKLVSVNDVMNAVTSVMSSNKQTVCKILHSNEPINLICDDLISKAKQHNMLLSNQVNSAWGYVSEFKSLTNKKDQEIGALVNEKIAAIAQKDAEIQALKNQHATLIAEMDKRFKCIEREKTIIAADSDFRIADLEQERETLISWRDATVTALEREKIEAIEQRDIRIKALEREMLDAVAQREARITALEHERNEAISQVHEHLAFKDNELRERDNRIKLKIEQIRQKDEQLADMHEQIKEKDEQLKSQFAEMNDRLKLKTEQLLQKNELLKQLSDQLIQKDEYWTDQLKQLSEHLKLKDEQLIQRDEQLADEKNKIKDIKEQLQRYEEQSKIKAEELMKVENTLVSRSAELVAKEKELATLREEKISEKQRIDEELRQKDKYIYDLLHSWSWRVTKPLRTLGGLFQKN